MSTNISAGIGGADLSQSAYDQLIASDEETARMRMNAALPNDSWVSMDDTIIQTRDRTLTVLSDIRGAGLETPASIFDKDVVWSRVDHQGEARIAMDPETRVEESTVGYDQTGAPLPVVMDDFHIGMRDRPSPDAPLQINLDTTGTGVASRHVAEKLEQLTIGGWEQTWGGDGYSLYGLTTHPDVNTGTLGDWIADPTLVRDDVRAMINAIKDDEYYPGNTGYWLYVSRDYDNALDEVDPDGTGDQTVRQRVEQLSGVSRVQPSDYLPDGTAVMFKPIQEVIDIAVAEEMQVLQWESLSGLSDHFRVLAAMTPRVKSTMSGQSGIAYFA